VLFTGCRRGRRAPEMKIRKVERKDRRPFLLPRRHLERRRKVFRHRLTEPLLTHLGRSDLQRARRSRGSGFAGRKRNDPPSPAALRPVAVTATGLPTGTPAGTPCP